MENHIYLKEFIELSNNRAYDKIYIFSTKKIA